MYRETLPQDQIRIDADPNQGRQGDIHLVKVDALPEGVTKQSSGRIQVALGETTGHDHVVQAGDLYFPTEYSLNDYRKFLNAEVSMPAFVVVEEETEVQHQEHYGQRLTPGTWEVVRQVAYDPMGDRIVRD